jgi:formate-dependent nitrite reductase cytochrome c552 subunit
MSRSGTQPAVAGNHGCADCFGKSDVDGKRTTITNRVLPG